MSRKAFLFEKPEGVFILLVYIAVRNQVKKSFRFYHFGILFVNDCDSLDFIYLNLYFLQKVLGCGLSNCGISIGHLGNIHISDTITFWVCILIWYHFPSGVASLHAF